MLLAELDAVLRWPKFRPHVSMLEVEAYLEMIRNEGIVLGDPALSAHPLGTDPEDEYLIDPARVARVDALVYGDTRLLALRDRLPVVSPREFLDSLVKTMTPRGTRAATVRNPYRSCLMRLMRLLVVLEVRG